MLCRYGGSSIAGSRVQSNIAVGFFDLFFQWSRISCSSRAPSRKDTRDLHCQSGLRARRARQTQWSRPNSTSATTNLCSSTSALSDDLRKVMRTLPHSVVVLTTTDSTSGSSNSQSRGMTLSSFTTLTLTPQPIVTFNIRRPSLTLSALMASKTFNIHILSATPSGAQLADAFTRGNNGRDPFADAIQTVQGLDVNESLVLNAPGVLRVLKCCLLEDSGCVEVGDHGLVLGRVLDIVHGQAEEDEVHGLCYADGRYRGVGGIIELEKE
ncbi:flavin reductase like domain-containing protein [Phlyctema vagabunda]|uniref:Flavin reductase like domain-containing protein n=1 Tax=Phlyctema vagabunda TaxID=108571 RepID=A0ABR4P8D1_9HELO